MIKPLLRNILIFLAIYIGYILIYVIDVESKLFPSKDNKVKSKVEFVYQQF